MTKSTKSHQRERSPLFENSSPVSATPTNALRALVHSPRARVSRASHACQVRAAQNKAKAGDFAAPTVSAIPRVRTYHTRKPSRFVHALSARPLKVHGGRESSTRADESKDFCQPSPVGEGGARSVTDEVSFVKKDLKILYAYRTFA